MASERSRPGRRHRKTPPVGDPQPTITASTGGPPLPDAELVSDIRALIADLPTYGYRRVHALLRRQAEATGRAVPNVKRVYRVMKLHGLLLQRHSGRGEERRHDGRIAVDIRNTRWCSDGLEIGCDNGEKVRVALRARLLRPRSHELRCDHKRHHSRGRA